VQFKGSGWYVTDYARKGSSAGKSEESAKTEPSGDKTEAKETKKESKKKGTDK